MARLWTKFVAMGVEFREEAGVGRQEAPKVYDGVTTKRACYAAPFGSSCERGAPQQHYEFARRDRRSQAAPGARHADAVVAIARGGCVGRDGARSERPGFLECRCDAFSTGPEPPSGTGIRFGQSWSKALMRWVQSGMSLSQGLVGTYRMRPRSRGVQPFTTLVPSTRMRPWQRNSPKPEVEAPLSEQMSERPLLRIGPLLVGDPPTLRFLGLSGSAGPLTSRVVLHKPKPEHPLSGVSSSASNTFIAFSASLRRPSLWRL